MRRELVLLTAGGLLLAITGTAAGAEAPQVATGAEAEKAAAAWLAGLGEDGLVLVYKAEKPDDPGLVGRGVIGRNSTMFTLTKPGWYLSLGFSDAIEPDTPLATVRKRLKYVALNRLPTPGLDVPGWEIRPQTPVSSFNKGVKIVGYSQGRIQLRVKTNFFALYGRNPNVLVPADAPMPPGTYFQIRKGFPLDLTIEAPMAMGK